MSHGDNLHEMSNPVFWGNIRKNISLCPLLKILPKVISFNITIIQIIALGRNDLTRFPILKMKDPFGSNGATRISRYSSRGTDTLSRATTLSKLFSFLSEKGSILRTKQEAHGPRFAHLSDIATADMQMLCNIYPILSSQLMKISSFEQFLVLKKNIWAWQSMEHDHE